MTARIGIRGARLQGDITMKNNTRTHSGFSLTPNRAKLLMAALLVLAAPLAMRHANAEEGGRSGKELVEGICINCHGTGANGAPKIGDREAWRPRASKGLTGLTQNALKGIRQMPAHGGHPELTDLEIGRAVTYMVNQSGGHWVEPASARDMAAERKGEKIVKAQCVKCHQDGVGGAPKIGDKSAWIPRLTQGVDNLVRSAIRGHGGMPPRGGLADLTDPEIRNAILYMYNPPAAPAKTAR
jgi:cytochrome c5